jgi:hypothetical protein
MVDEFPEPVQPIATGPDDEAPRPSGGLQQVIQSVEGHGLSIMPNPHLPGDVGGDGSRGECECGWTGTADSLAGVESVHREHLDGLG